MKVCGHLHVPAALSWTIIHSIQRIVAGGRQSRSRPCEQDNKLFSFSLYRTTTPQSSSPWPDARQVVPLLIFWKA